MVEYSYVKGQAEKVTDTTKTLTELMHEAIAYEYVTAMLASDLSSAFACMTLNGHKRMERLFSVDEFMENHCWRSYMVDVMGICPEVAVSYSSPKGLTSVQDVLNCKHTFLLERRACFARMLELCEEDSAEDKSMLYDFIAHMLEMTQCHITKLERAYKMYERTGWNGHEINVVDRMLHKKFKKKEEKYGKYYK